MKFHFLQLVSVAVSVLLRGRADAAFVTTKPTVVGLSSSAAAASTTSATITLNTVPFLPSKRPPRTVSLQQSLQTEQFTDALSSVFTTTTTTATSSIWLATVDSDIAKLSDNEFAPIFLGGIMVMAGGVISALIVGLILEKRDLYANVVADSYAQGNAEDEAFWKGLSDEEKKKTQDAIQRLRQSKGLSPEQTVVVPSLTATSAASEPEASAAPTSNRAVVETGAPQNGSSAQKLDIFSDYADS